MIVDTTIGGISVKLFLVEPDWNHTVRLEMSIGADAVKGGTGKESRTPDHVYPRFKMRFVPEWDKDDLEDIQTMAATMGTTRVAMPMFPDMRTDITDSFVFSGSHYVTWDRNGNYSVDVNTYNHVAPLMFGYLEDIDVRAFTETVGKQQISFFEDSPSSHKVSVVSTTVDDDFDLDPDWTEVREGYNFPIEYQEIGAGRERLLKNQEDQFFYSEDAQFTLLGVSDINYLAYFWYSKGGRLNSFNVPAFFQPSANTAETPNAFKARFRGEVLRIDFSSTTVAKSILGFLQLPWELANPDEDVQAPNCYAFDFAFEVPGKSNIRYIDWEDSVTISSNPYTPHRITVKDLQQGTRLFGENASLVYAHDASNPLLEFVQGGLERLVSLTILEGNPQTPSTFKTVFKGKLKNLKGREREITAEFVAFGGVFDRKLPGFHIQNKCNYTLGDANCKIDLQTLAASGNADSTDLSNNDTEIFLAAMTGPVANVNDPNGNPGDRFAGGYLEVGTGDNYQIRLIRKTVIGTGTDRTLTVNRPLDPTKLDASDGVVTVFPGCAGAKWECEDFFSNYVNFGGHPYIPDELETYQGERPSVGK